MPEIMEARLIPGVGFALNLGGATYPDKEPIGLVIAEGMPRACHKNSRAFSRRAWQVAASVNIRDQCLGELGANRYPARLKEFGVPDRDESLVEVHIRQRQRERFADPHGTPIEQQQQ